MLLAAGEYEGLKLGLMIISLVTSVVSTIGVAWIGIRTRARDRKDDQQAVAIKDLQTKLESAGADGKVLTEKLIEERIRSASHEINNHVQGFVAGLELLRAQATAWAEEIKELGDADHEQRITLTTQISNLKDWMGKTFADKQDLKSIDGIVRQLGQKVAVLEDRSN